MKHLMSVLFVFLLLIGSVVVAQEVTVEPTAEATAEPTPVPPGITLPDLDPEVDEVQVGLEGFLARAETAIVLAVLAYAVVQFLKWWKPQQEHDTHKIYLRVVGTVSVVYLIASAFGVGELLERGVDVFAALTPPVLTIISIFAGSSALYRMFNALDVPYLGQPQGAKSRSLGKPDTSFRSPEHAAG